MEITNCDALTICNVVVKGNLVWKITLTSGTVSESFITSLALDIDGRFSLPGYTPPESDLDEVTEYQTDSAENSKEELTEIVKNSKFDTSTAGAIVINYDDLTNSTVVEDVLAVLNATQSNDVVSNLLQNTELQQGTVSNSTELSNQTEAEQLEGLIVFTDEMRARLNATKSTLV